MDKVLHILWKQNLHPSASKHYTTKEKLKLRVTKNDTNEDIADGKRAKKKKKENYNFVFRRLKFAKHRTRLVLT